MVIQYMQYTTGLRSLTSKWLKALTFDWCSPGVLVAVDSPRGGFEPPRQPWLERWGPRLSWRRRGICGFLKAFSVS